MPKKVQSLSLSIFISFSGSEMVKCSLLFFRHEMKKKKNYFCFLHANSLEMEKGLKMSLLLVEHGYLDGVCMRYGKLMHKSRFRA